MLGNQLSLENVPAREAETSFDIGRRQRLPLDDDLVNVRSIVGKPVEYMIGYRLTPFVPGALGQAGRACTA